MTNDQSSEQVRVLRDFFPLVLLHQLQEHIRGNSVRKETLDLRVEHLPRAIQAATVFASARLHLPFNTCVAKWYRTTDPEPSGAYDWHVDPVELRYGPLVLATAYGEALLEYRTHRSIHGIDCRTNTVVVIDSSLQHRVSPPRNSDGERLFLFLGWREPQDLTAP